MKTTATMAATATTPRPTSEQQVREANIVAARPRTWEQIAAWMQQPGGVLVVRGMHTDYTFLVRPDGTCRVTWEGGSSEHQSLAAAHRQRALPRQLFVDAIAAHTAVAIAAVPVNKSRAAAQFAVWQVSRRHAARDLNETIATRRAYPRHPSGAVSAEYALVAQVRRFRPDDERLTDSAMRAYARSWQGHEYDGDDSHQQEYLHAWLLRLHAAEHKTTKRMEIKR